MATTRYEPASRKNVDRTSDPYLPRKGSPSAGVCPICHAISRKKRWYTDADESAALVRSGAPLRRCPACCKIADGFPSGVLILRGGFLKFHREELLKIARNEEQRARGINPLERIMEIRDGDRGVEVLTTDGKLAQRIGREIRKACRGTIAYKWAEDGDPVRVTWTRDA
ncbi:MAG: uncharacterized protein H6Q84_1209 [Deltaproteobacteria bacterium]|nr:uncharacterized protein [Deltaproteobacteria bacterium]